MSRALVEVGETEPIEHSWLLNDTEVPTSIEVRAYIVDAGVKKYDNGTAYTTTDAQLSGTYAAGPPASWKGSYTYPAYALGLEVHLEARPIGLADLVRDIVVHSRRVIAALPDANVLSVSVNP